MTIFRSLSLIAVIGKFPRIDETPILSDTYARKIGVFVPRSKKQGPSSSHLRMVLYSWTLTQGAGYHPFQPGAEIFILLSRTLTCLHLAMCSKRERKRQSGILAPLVQ